jgi:hypothetical protein
MSPGKPDHYLAVYSRRLAASKSTHRAHFPPGRISKPWRRLQRPSTIS